MGGMDRHGRSPGLGCETSICLPRNKRDTAIYIYIHMCVCVYVDMICVKFRLNPHQQLFHLSSVPFVRNETRKLFVRV